MNLAILLFVLISACQESRHDKNQQAITQKVERQTNAPLATVVNFLESMMNGDTATFYSLIQKDSLFYYTKMEGGFKSDFSALKLHIPYFALYGVLIKSPHAECDRNSLAHFNSNLISQNQNVVEYDLTWAFQYCGAKEVNPDFKQKVRLYQDSILDEWKITYLKFDLAAK